MTRVLLHDGAVNGATRFHYLDPWHMMHLGVGKHWIASGVMLMQPHLPGSTIEQRTAFFAHGYKEFCRKKHLTIYLSHVDMHTFGLIGGSEPCGTWNKAAVTSNFMMYLEEFLDLHPEIAKASQAMKVLDPSSWRLRATYFFAWRFADHKFHIYFVCYILVGLGV